MAMVMMGMSVVIVTMCMTMVLFGKAHFKAMNMVPMAHAQDRLEFVGFMNLLFRFQKQPCGLEFKGLLCAIGTDGLDGDALVLTKRLYRHGLVIRMKAKVWRNTGFKDFQLDDAVASIDDIATMRGVLMGLCSDLVVTCAQKHPDRHPKHHQSGKQHEVGFSLLGNQFVAKFQCRSGKCPNND